MVDKRNIVYGIFQRRDLLGLYLDKQDAMDISRSMFNSEKEIRVNIFEDDVRFSGIDFCEGTKTVIWVRQLNVN